MIISFHFREILPKCGLSEVDPMVTGDPPDMNLDTSG